MQMQLLGQVVENTPRKNDMSLPPLHQLPLKDMNSDMVSTQPDGVSQSSPRIHMRKFVITASWGRVTYFEIDNPNDVTINFWFDYDDKTPGMNTPVDLQIKVQQLRMVEFLQDKLQKDAHLRTMFLEKSIHVKYEPKANVLEVKLYSAIQNEYSKKVFLDTFWRVAQLVPPHLQIFYPPSPNEAFHEATLGEPKPIYEEEKVDGTNDPSNWEMDLFMYTWTR